MPPNELRRSLKSRRPRAACRRDAGGRFRPVHARDQTQVSKELAAQIDRSVRALHSASVSAVGMRLHSYLRSKRLSQVRLAAALANGFGTWEISRASTVAPFVSCLRKRAHGPRNADNWICQRSCPTGSELTPVSPSSPVLFETE